MRDPETMIAILTSSNLLLQIAIFSLYRSIAFSYGDPQFMRARQQSSIYTTGKEILILAFLPKFESRPSGETDDRTVPAYLVSKTIK